eukprot:UN03458
MHIDREQHVSPVRICSIIIDLRVIVNKQVRRKNFKGYKKVCTKQKKGEGSLIKSVENYFVLSVSTLKRLSITYVVCLPHVKMLHK